MFRNNISLESHGTRRRFKPGFLFSWVFDRDVNPTSLRQLKINYSKSSKPQKVIRQRTMRHLRIDHSKSTYLPSARKVIPHPNQLSTCADEQPGHKPEEQTDCTARQEAEREAMEEAEREAKEEVRADQLAKEAAGKAQADRLEKETADQADAM